MGHRARVPTSGTRMRLTPALLLSLCCLVGADACALASSAPTPASTGTTADAVALPLPWKRGQVLRYQTEQLEATIAPGGREKVQTTSTTEVTTVDAGKGGFVQHWRSHGVEVEVLDGYATFAGIAESVGRAFEDLPMILELDAEGSPIRLRNIDAISERMRQALRPAIRKLELDALERGLKNVSADFRT